LGEQQNVIHEKVAMLLGGFQKSEGQANAPTLDSNVWTAMSGQQLSGQQSTPAPGKGG
jgi:hypothetical protein